MIKQNAKGFTLLELLIASSIFSIILLLCSFGLVQVGKVYYKGAGSSRTQAALRAISDDVAQAVQYSGKSVHARINLTNTNEYQQCIGNRRYTYHLGDRTGRVLVVESFQSTCVEDIAAGDALLVPGSALPSANNARELMPAGMRLLQFAVTADLAGSQQNDIKIRVGLGDQDLYHIVPGPMSWTVETDINKATCKGGAGQQFCATAEIDTTVRRRVTL